MLKELETKLLELNERRRRLHDSLYASQRLNRRDALIKEQKRKAAEAYAGDATEKQITQMRSNQAGELEAFDLNEARQHGEMLKCDREIAETKREIKDQRQDVAFKSSPGIVEDFRKEKSKLAAMNVELDALYKRIYQAEAAHDSLRAAGPYTKTHPTIESHDRALEKLAKPISALRQEADVLRNEIGKQEQFVESIRVNIDTKMAAVR